MTQYQGRSGRLLSGGRIRPQATKRKRMMGRAPTETQIGEDIRKRVRVHGGKFRYRLYRAKFANVVDPETNKVVKAEIKDVVTNPASRDYSRRRVITKNAVIQTSLGNARVTNRPSKEGFVNAILIKDE